MRKIEINQRKQKKLKENRKKKILKGKNFKEIKIHKPFKHLNPLSRNALLRYALF